MVNFGCVSTLVKILTKQMVNPEKRMEALNTIYLILEDKNHSHIHAVEKADGIEAIAKLQVFYSFDDSSCFAIQNVTLCAG